MNSRPKKTRLTDQTEILANADEEGKSKDWIDELPSCIVSYILSLLTIKDAWDASLVSRRWHEHLWNSILTRPNLEFDIPNIFGSRYAGAKFTDTTSDSIRLINQFKTPDFVQRVNAVLKHYRGKKVESFKVAFFLDGSTADLDNWIRFAITKGVEVLHLHLFQDPIHGTKKYVFPYELLSELKSSTLKHLSLHRCVLRPSPDHFDRFNQLTSLCLNQVDLGETFLQACMFSVCLFLESLTLIRCHLDSCLIVSGSLLHLNDLKLFQCFNLSRIEISALNLISFEYTGRIPTISFIQAPRLSRIYFWGLNNNTIANANALTQFASTPALETLQLLIVQEVPQSIPTFRYIKQLDLNIVLGEKSDYNVHDLMLVLNLLKATPVLEELVIKVRHPKYSEKNQQERTEISGFAHDCLRRVKMQGFQSNACEIEFAIWLLKYSLKLEIMVIDPFGDMYLGGDMWEAIDAYGLRSARSWEEHRAFVQKELKRVQTHAQVIVL
ncbi:putative F-box/LRR-repeat protein At3g58880 [Rosa chinensis]|uniref:putative F-box/LRR-repeat protein At3g58880 n=1 Tax=Rosa chinensis TaxID=74649 RepID=UPI001AD8A434|nr:putative F-box/LRR-repeat protein At3g58880 [Rosa chinensis]XP_040371754.1 putative F-box/LRR-repeat protein At3g58880 [Rosa chinensis]